MSRIEKKSWKRIDWITLIIVFVLVGFGLISLANIMATPFSGQEQSLSDYMSKLNLEYVQRQAQNFLFGLAAMIIILVIDYQIYKPLISYVYIGNLALLALLFVVGEIRGGALGWFVLEQIDRALQPSELCKVTLIVLLSKVVSRAMDKDGGLKHFKDIVTCLVLCAIPAGIVIWQSDFGTAFVFIIILICIFFVGRISWKYIIAALVIAAIVFPICNLYLFDDYQRLRIDVFLNPDLDPLNAGYNVSRSKIAIGSGQMWGKGYFTEGTLAQLRFVPHRNTDFIFSGIGEGLGFVGGAALIITYFLLAFRWLWIAIKAKDNFGTCLVVGSIGMLIAHVFENIGMTIGLMPVTGIPLPFISYGGSNMLTNMLCVGIVLNVWMRRPQKKDGFNQTKLRL